MKTFALLASTLIVGAAMPAFANDSHKAMTDAEITAKYNSMDTDKNESISKSEADAAGKSDADFAAIDTDKSNTLSLAEVKMWKQKEWNSSSIGSNSVDNHGKATGSGTSSVGGANERVRDGDATKTSH